MDWDHIDMVLLDMDGTLLDLHFDNYFWQQYLPAAYALKTGSHPSKAQEELFARFRAVQGTLDWYCLDYWQRELVLDILELKRQIQYLVGLRPGAESFLELLRRQGKPCWLVTNAHPGSLALKMELTGLSSRLDGLVSTHQYGYPKEEQAFWQGLQQDVGFDPARTLFVDDSPAILAAGATFGIRHLWAIALPDSRGELRPDAGFPRVMSFDPLVIAESAGL